MGMVTIDGIYRYINLVKCEQYLPPKLLWFDINSMNLNLWPQLPPYQVFQWPLRMSNQYGMASST